MYWRFSLHSLFSSCSSQNHIQKPSKSPKVACIRLGNIHVNPVTSLEIAREFLKKHDAVFATRPITMGIEYVSQGFKSLVVVQWGEHQKKMEKVVAPENKFI